MLWPPALPRGSRAVGPTAVGLGSVLCWGAGGDGNGLSLGRAPRGVLTPVSLVSAFLDLGLSLPLSSTPPLSLPASPLASDLDLFLPWEAQGQSLGVRGTCFVLGCICLRPHPHPALVPGTPPVCMSPEEDPGPSRSFLGRRGAASVLVEGGSK